MMHDTCSTVCFRNIKIVESALIYKEKCFINTPLHYIGFNLHEAPWSVCTVIQYIAADFLKQAISQK